MIGEPLLHRGQSARLAATGGTDGLAALLMSLALIVVARSVPAARTEKADAADRALR